MLSVAADPARLAVLSSLKLMDAPPDDDFDRLTGIAASLVDAPLALLTVLDAERQWFTSAAGTHLREAPVESSFCVHTVALGAMMVVEDARLDPRFASNRWVTGEPHIRFYLGLPVFALGQIIGTLCVYDFKPRSAPAPGLVEQLRGLADLAGSLFTLKHSSQTGRIARAALAREEKRRGIALEAAGLASWVWDTRSHIIECDPLLPELFGLPPATHIRARTLFGMIDRRDLRAGRARFREALATTDDYAGEYRIRNTEPARWLSARGRVVERDESGAPTLVFGVNFDITERRESEERQRLLLREINHRVKNTLATVQALASQTVRHARQPREFLEAFSGRLQALGAAHNLLSDVEWRGIAIRDLIALEVKPFDDAASRIRTDGPDLTLPPDQALGLGLILHELASNALKYGALSTPSGQVLLNWHVEKRPGATLMLQWSERGGPAVSLPDRQGFGSILIKRSLAKVLGSAVEHEFQPAGVHAAVTLPLGNDET